MTRSLGMTLLVVALLVPARPARGQLPELAGASTVGSVSTDGEPGDETEARRLTEQGTRAWQRGDQELALAYFKLAYRVFPSPNLHYNMGLAFAGLRRWREAAGEFEAFLHDATSAPEDRRRYAAAQIELIDRRLGRVFVTSNFMDARLVVDGEPALLRRTFRVLPGPHTVIAMRQGQRTFMTDVRLRPGQTLRLHAQLEPHPALAPPVPPRATAAPDRSLLSRWWFWGAVGAVAAGTATVLIVD